MAHYTQVALENKLLEMYPEISVHNLAVSLSFDSSKDAWVVRLKKGEKELTTQLAQKDAEECMNNIKCVYLGLQIGEFIKNFELKK